MGEFVAQFQLVDAVEFQKLHPKTLELPDELNRRNVRIGEWAKLIFLFPVNRYPQTERMWVRVVGIRAEGYVGVLDNDPANIEFIRTGETIKFEPRHVISIYPPRTYFDRLTLE